MANIAKSEDGKTLERGSSCPNLQGAANPLIKPLLPLPQNNETPVLESATADGKSDKSQEGSSRPIRVLQSTLAMYAGVGSFLQMIRSPTYSPFEEHHTLVTCSVLGVALTILLGEVTLLLKKKWSQAARVMRAITYLTAFVTFLIVTSFLFLH